MIAPPGGIKNSAYKHPYEKQSIRIFQNGRLYNETTHCYVNLDDILDYEDNFEAYEKTNKSGKIIRTAELKQWAKIQPLKRDRILGGRE